MPKMKIAVVPKPGADFVIEEREIPTPGPGQVRIKVQACVVCASDHIVKEGLMPFVTYPRSPGHEVAGVIDEVGPNVTSWKKGQKVGVGWHGGHDFTCINCRRGDFINCVNEKWTGNHYDGGYAEYMVAPWEAVAAMPDSLDPAEAAPLLCAGITTFNSIRRAGRIPWLRDGSHCGCPIGTRLGLLAVEHRLVQVPRRGAQDSHSRALARLD